MFSLVYEVIWVKIMNIKKVKCALMTLALEINFLQGSRSVKESMRFPMTYTGWPEINNFI